MDGALLDAARGFYQDEINDHQAYAHLGAHARDPRLKQQILRVARMEQRHARFWQGVIEARGGEVPAPRVRRLRLALLRLMQEVVGPALLVSALELGEAGAFKRYHAFLKEAPLDDAEKGELRGIILDEMEHERLFRRESTGLGGAHIRDFVLGMNDGLVEILGAVTGLSAVYAGHPVIVGASGLVVGVAGALSMGVGGFVSVRSQRQVDQSGKDRMEALLDVAPERVTEEYKDKLTDAGIPPALAAEVVEKLGENREALPELLVGEVEQNELRAALFTGVAYLIGVLFPVLPYFFAPTSFLALGLSVAFAGLALAAVAAAISTVSGISVRAKIAEMVTLAFAAALVAYGFGKITQLAFGVVA